MQPIEYFPYVWIVLSILVGVFIAIRQDKLSSRQFFAAMYGSISVLILLLLFYIFVLHDAYAGSGSILQIYGYSGKQGDALLIHNRVRGYLFRGEASDPAYRLDILNPLTGNKLNRVVLGPISDASVLATDHDSIWYTSFRDKLHLRNYYTGEMLNSPRDPLTENPVVLSSIQDSLAAPGGGNYARLPENHVAQLPKAVVYNAGNPDWCFFSDERKISKKALYPQLPFFLNPLKSDPNIFQMTKLKLKSRNYVPTDTIINPKLAFRKASFLQCAIEHGIPVTSEQALKKLYEPKYYIVGIHNPESIFITSSNFDNNRQLRFSLSRVTLDGQVLWSISESDLGITIQEYQENQNDYDNGNVISAFGFFKNMLVAGVGGRIISLDVNTGKTLWNVHY